MIFKNANSTMLNVAETPGLYGAVKIEESLIQKIWEEQSFDTSDMSTLCGKEIILIDRGEWNRGEEGPDFRNAQLRIGGKRCAGDIEIHFRPSDWERHGHCRNPNFNRVILHVCLFAERNEQSFSVLENGNKVPVLHFLPCLTQGVEEYAEELALRQLSGRESGYFSSEELSRLKEADVYALAKQRWDGKLNFAKLRINKTGWEAACHQWFLEVLGYRRNRAPMTQIALEFPLASWQDSSLRIEDVFRSQKDWKLRGCRPLNHPLNRLKQYHRLCLKNPDWVSGLKEFSVCPIEDPVAATRASLGLGDCRKNWQNHILKNIFGGNRANTLWVDACLPLYCVLHGVNAFALWYHWPVGDCPQSFRSIANDVGWIGRGRQHPFSNGMVQAIKAHMLASNFEERRALVEPKNSCD